MATTVRRERKVVGVGVGGFELHVPRVQGRDIVISGGVELRVAREYRVINTSTVLEQPGA